MRSSLIVGRTSIRCFPTIMKRTGIGFGTQCTEKMTIFQYRQKVQGISENLILWIEEILESLDKDIVKLIHEQLEEGKRGDDTLLPLYKESTKKMKAERGTILMGERIALIDTGQFWNSFFSSIYQGSIEIDSKDRLRDELVGRYREEIFLISKTQMNYLASIVQPKLKTKINEYLSS